MDILDIFFKKYSYKFPKGYPDMNNEQDILIMENILGKLGVNEEEIINYDQEIKDLLSSLSTEENKKKLITYLSKLNNGEDEKDELIKDELILKLKEKNIIKKQNVYYILSSSKINEQLLKYLNSPDEQLKLEDLISNKNLLEVISNKTPFPKEYISDIINFSTVESGKNVGDGEIALALFGYKGKKLKEGDVEIEGKIIEIKGNNSRFTGKGGRERGLEDIFDNLAKTYPNSEPSLNLYKYFLNIINIYPNSLKDINNILNNIYPNSEKNIIITKDNLNNEILSKKYISNYINSNPENDLYMLISKSFNYNIYTPEELLNNIENGRIKDISRSTSYPQLVL